MLENQGKKLVYVACPFGGKAEAIEKAKDAIRWFYHRDALNGDMNYVYVSPVLSFGFMYEEVSYQEGIEQCMELLTRCDEIIFLKGWEDSKGCCMEHGYAMAKNIPVLYGDALDDIIKECSDDLRFKKKVKEDSNNNKKPSINPGDIGAINPFRIAPAVKPISKSIVRVGDKRINPLTAEWCDTLEYLENPSLFITPETIEELKRISTPPTPWTPNKKNMEEDIETLELRSIDMGDKKYIVNKDSVNISIYEKPSQKSKVTALLSPGDYVNYKGTVVNENTGEIWFETDSSHYIIVNETKVILEKNENGLC